MSKEEEEICDYDKRLCRYRRIIAGFGRKGEIALRFLDHSFCLALSGAKSSYTRGQLQPSA
ncbi:hypothetical protein H5T51_08700 [Candidatus Bathyarchaeota archaeon]|nr:hypothetical protein [Candidatus Bathyarchaeota archaeon]